MLVLIEGIAGTGKSTLTSALSTALKELGVDCRGIQENAPDHPIRRVGTVGVLSPDQFVASNEERWRALLSGARPAVTLLDGALLQYTLGTLLCDDVDAAFLDGVIRRWFAMLAKFESRLVYLTQPSARHTLARVREERGPAWWAGQIQGITEIAFGRAVGGSPDEIAIAFSEAMRSQSDRYVDLWPGPLLALDTERDDVEVTTATALRWICEAL